ncbi:MAG: hypothetical protein H7122_16065 [Chitinophagaceae bacterium]|nr:hypothetical protein [Chitinophagaceae bacterium]
MELIYSVSKKQAANTKAVRFIIIIDVIWVLASIVAIVLLHSTITVIGTTAIAAIALWVAGMAYLQNKGLKTSSTFKTLA